MKKYLYDHVISLIFKLSCIDSIEKYTILLQWHMIAQKLISTHSLFPQRLSPTFTVSFWKHVPSALSRSLLSDDLVIAMRINVNVRHPPVCVLFLI